MNLMSKVGILLVYVLHLTLRNKILLKIFGYMQSDLFVSSIIYVNLLRLLSSFLSLLLINLEHSMVIASCPRLEGGL